MDEAQESTPELIIFLDDQREERHEIRKVWYNDRFYFSVVDDAGRAGKQAREVAEAALGEPVVSPENYMHLKKVKGEQRKRTLKAAEQGQTDHTQETLF